MAVDMSSDYKNLIDSVNATRMLKGGTRVLC